MTVTLKVGDKVLADLGGTGTIKQTQLDGTYDVNYNGGDWTVPKTNKNKKNKKSARQRNECDKIQLLVAQSVRLHTTIATHPRLHRYSILINI